MLLSLTLVLSFLTASNADSLNIFRTLVCDQEQLQVKCPQHTKIIVDKVFYGKSASSVVEACQNAAQYRVRVARKGRGRPKHRQRILNAAATATQFDDMECDVTNARMRILEKCHNKDECQFRVNPRFFGRDPCPSTKKYLQISYKCRPSEFMSDTYCEDGQVELQCLPGQALTIVSATYGRTLTTDNLPNCGEKMLPGILAVDEIVFDENFIQSAESGIEQEYEEDELADVNVETAAHSAKQDKKSMNDAQYEEDFREQMTEKQPIVIGHTDSRKLTVNDRWSSFHTYNSSNNNNGSKYHNGSGNGSSCENGTSANLVVYFHRWITLKRFLSSNKSELLQYFCISAAAGATLILLFCLINQLIKKYCNQPKRCSTNSSSSSSNSSDAGGRTSNIINDYNLSKMDDHMMVVNDYSTNRRSSPLTTRQYYLTDDALGSIPAVKNQKKNAKRRSSTMDLKGAVVHGSSSTSGFYKPAPDRASIDYMAIGSPLGADSLLEDEYYV
uniref:SUEL-type lectin domain-containing protein n=1 Tax=Romanomermis culicivorax TaxID=13658 RepID=A0A915HP47_ROMCU